MSYTGSDCTIPRTNLYTAIASRLRTLPGLLPKESYSRKRLVSTGDGIQPT
jgi:hypothetical protein